MARTDWTRDELIVTLDFYLKHPAMMPGKTSPEIFELSNFLNRLGDQIGASKGEKFRNANGVYMKLMNFRRFDPNYDGKGLERGGKQDEVVWDTFANDPAKLAKVSASIRSFVDTGEAEATFLAPDVEEEEEEASEGRLLTRTHRVRERDPSIVRKKKQRVLEEHGRIACIACGFDFEQAYGSRGNGYIECHHTKPLSELAPSAKTKISDLELLCSNCHRIVHRGKPWLSIEELKALINRQ